MRVQLNQSDIDALQHRMSFNDAKLRDVSFYMLQLVEDRFRTAGASGDHPWPPKKLRQWGYDDGRAILTGTTGLLRKSFAAVSTSTQAIVGSWAPYAAIHQVGTIGKGGTKPTIVPKKAKALFIPITDKAIKSIRLTGVDAGKVRTLHRLQVGAERMLSAYRVGTRTSRKDGTTNFTALVRGRVYNGRLQRWDKRKQEYVDGIPDFIFLRKVDIPPRPMLPTSPRELKQLTSFCARRLFQ